MAALDAVPQGPLRHVIHDWADSSGVSIYRHPAAVGRDRSRPAPARLRARVWRVCSPSAGGRSFRRWGFQACRLGGGRGLPHDESVIHEAAHPIGGGGGRVGRPHAHYMIGETAPRYALVFADDLREEPPPTPCASASCSGQRSTCPASGPGSGFRLDRLPCQVADAAVGSRKTMANGSLDVAGMASRSGSVRPRDVHEAVRRFGLCCWRPLVRAAFDWSDIGIVGHSPPGRARADSAHCGAGGRVDRGEGVRAAHGSVWGAARTVGRNVSEQREGRGDKSTPGGWGY